MPSIVADINVKRTKDNLAATHWPQHRYQAASGAEALAEGTTWVGDDAESLINISGLDVVVEATGDPDVGIRHALLAIERGRDLVMVTLECT